MRSKQIGPMLDLCFLRGGQYPKIGIPRVNIQTTCRKPMVSIGKCSGAQLSPPSLAQCCSSKSSLRAVAGDVTEAVWGASSLGALLKAKRPDMEVIPSPQLRCGPWRNWMGRFLVGGLEHFFFHNIWDNPSH